MSCSVLGWDIGGVNTKVARVDAAGGVTVRSRPFELQRDPAALVSVLRGLALDLDAAPSHPPIPCTLTMTAELSQMFRTKREGVGFVVSSVEAAFPDADLRVFSADGRFLSPDQARANPLDVAAANWAATARLVASGHPTALLLDVGTTTTDIIPIVDGAVVASGATDPDRLATGELVYTGALRTPVEAIVHVVPYRDGYARVSAEGFALAGDIHVWRHCLDPADYSVGTPDGRPATRHFAGERIARVVCADRELLDDSGVNRIADAVAAAQIETVVGAIRQVVGAHPDIRTAVVTGLGAFIAAEAARQAGLDVVALAAELGLDAARYAPAAAVALLYRNGLAEAHHHDCLRSVRVQEDPSHRGVRVQAHPSHLHTRESPIVIKIGGGLLSHVQHLDCALKAVADLARTRPVLVVPGGGPFADVVRTLDRRLQLGDDSAHWMAIAAMDQYSYLLAPRIANAVIVTAADEAVQAMRGGCVAVLAPSRWLKDADPLPHTWDVTSDSIAAWCAAELGASTLVLVKPPGARGDDVVDPWFRRVLPRGIECHVVPADEAPALLATKSTKI